MGPIALEYRRPTPGVHTRSESLASSGLDQTCPTSTNAAPPSLLPISGKRASRLASRAAAPPTGRGENRRGLFVANCVTSHWPELTVWAEQKPRMLSVLLGSKFRPET